MTSNLNVVQGVDSAIALSAMTRVCAPGSKSVLNAVLVPLVERLREDPDSFEGERRLAVERLMADVRQSKRGGPLSYGQAAKLVDMVLKFFYFDCYYFAGLPLPPLAHRLHPVIDSPILWKAKRWLRDEDGVTVKATTLAALDAPEHAAVERKLREKAEKENLSVPEYDSKLWEEISGPRRKRWAV